MQQQGYRDIQQIDDIELGLRRHVVVVTVMVRAWSSHIMVAMVVVVRVVRA